MPQNQDHGDPSIASADVAIEARGLSKAYRRTLRRARVDALSGIDLSVRRSEIFGFLGHNGAGKSTTIKILVGLIRATSGEARVSGAPPGSVRARASIGYLPENPALDGAWTPEEFLTMSGRLARLGDLERGREIERLIARLGLSSIRSRPMRKLSKGQVQLVGLAHAFLGRPPILILDEPMSGLDPGARRVVRELLLAARDDGASVFLCSHILADVERLCDRVALVGSGRLLGVHDVDEVRRVASSRRCVTIAGPGVHSGSGGPAGELPSTVEWREVGGGCLSATVTHDTINAVVSAAIASGFDLVSVDDQGDGFEAFVLDRLGLRAPATASEPASPSAVGTRRVAGGGA